MKIKYKSTKPILKLRVQTQLLNEKGVYKETEIDLNNAARYTKDVDINVIMFVYLFLNKYYFII